MRTLIGRLFGRRPDPTAEWGPTPTHLPRFDLGGMRLGTLSLGDPIESARDLGRPDSFRWTRSDYCELLYASSGFQIDFEGGRFCYLTFFIGEDECLPSHPELRLARPQLVDGTRLTRETDQTAMEAHLGLPTSKDSDDSETVLCWIRGDTTLELELDRAGRLKRWNVFPTRDPGLALATPPAPIAPR